MSMLGWSDIRWCAALLMAFGLIGCAKSAHQSGQVIFDKVLPPDLRSQADPNLRFSDLRTSPEQYVGKVAMFSGIVLGAKRKTDHTEIEILQLPAEPGEPPTSNRSSSEGRFLAVKQGLDPAALEAGNPITVIGQVKGKAVKMLDETEYTYPVLDTLHVVEWQKVQPGYGGYGSPYPYGYYGRGFGYPYYGYGYPYYGPFGYGYAPFGFRGSSSAPSPPPPQSTPPEFRRRDE